MKTIEIKLFTLDELSAEAQTRVIDKNRYFNTDDNWHEDMLAEYKEELAEAGFTDAVISYSGFWSQGDGLSFDAKIDIDKFCETANEKRIAKLIHNGELSNFEICKNSFSNHYSHVNTRYVESPEVSHNTNIETIIEALYIKINDKRVELCDKFYRALEKEYDCLISDESIKQNLIANEYTYLENGTRFDE